MSIYKDYLDKNKWSFSALHSYETCPYQFYLKRIEREEETQNGYATIGQYDHGLLEQIFNKKITPEEALERYLDEYEDIDTGDISDATTNKKINAFSEYLAELDIDDFFNKYEVLGVEKRFNWKIDKYNMIGFADLILRRKSDCKVILVDHKSAGHFMQRDGKTPLKNQAENLAAYTKQMYLYADAMHKTMGIYPDLIVWNHFLDGGKKSVIEFDEHDFLDALDWAKNTIENIYKDEEFVNKHSFIMCNKLCGFRDICEYKDVIEDE